MGFSPGDSPGKNPGVGRRALLQGIFPLKVLNPHLLHLLLWRQILYALCHRGSPPLPESSCKQRCFEIKAASRWGGHQPLPPTLPPKSFTSSLAIPSHCQPLPPCQPPQKSQGPVDKHLSRGGSLLPKPFSFRMCLLSLPTVLCCLVMGEMSKQKPPMVGL